jgi:hypothetical protein
MTDERRKHGRFQLVMAASWDGAGSNTQARTTDVSATGCFIDTLGQVVVGETLNFKLIPPEGKEISMQAEVVYQQPGLGFGVRFTKISDSDRLRLDALLERKD